MRAVCGFFFHAEDGIGDVAVTGVQACALPISCAGRRSVHPAQNPCVRRRRERATGSLKWSPWRSEERRVGKEGRSSTAARIYKKNTSTSQEPFADLNAFPVVNITQHNHYTLRV